MMNYKCSNCGSAISKNAAICPNCHARLAGIRCQSCGFVGGTGDFLNDRCPRCSTIVQTSAAFEEFKANPDKVYLKACIWGVIVIAGMFLLIALFAALQ